GTAPNTNDNQH
ncbi:unnamed protein product, partial [Rotaria sp. Silwood1]